MNPIRGKLSDHAAKGYSQIDAYEHDLQQIYLRARNRIEMQLSTFLQRRNASFTGPRLIGLFDDLNEMFPEFEEEYRETYQHALEYMAHQNYAAALQDMGLRENVVGSMDKSLFDNMLQDGFQHIAGATRNMQTEVISELRRMSARVMREAALTGMTRAEVSRHLAAELLYAPDAKLRSFQFIDAGGRRWKTEKYFNMLGRTLLHNNARECYLAGCAKAGSDIVTISVSGDCCDVCGKYENALLSISGATPGLPTLQEAMDEGLFHPNCTHRIIAVPESIARKYYGMGGGSGKKVEVEKPTTQTNQTGRTGQTSQTKAAGQQKAQNNFIGANLLHKPQETHEQHLARRQQQWNAAYKKRCDRWYRSIIKAGASKEIATELVNIYTPEMVKLGKPPEIKVDAKEIPHYNHQNNTITMRPAEDKTGYNTLHTPRHEMGHWWQHRAQIKDPNLPAAIEAAGKEDWKQLKSKVSQEDLNKYFKRDLDFERLSPLENNEMENYKWWNEHLFHIKSSQVGNDEMRQIANILDSIGSLTYGQYGGGHYEYADNFSRNSVVMYYAKQNRDRIIFGEAIANLKDAIKSGDIKLKLVFPNLWSILDN